MWLALVVVCAVIGLLFFLARYGFSYLVMRRLLAYGADDGCSSSSPVHASRVREAELHGARASSMGAAQADTDEANNGA